MTGILIVAVIVLAVWVLRLSRRLAVVEASIRVSHPIPAPPDRPPVATPRPDPMPKATRRPRPRIAAPRFEDLVGGRLPIWVGGLALVVSGIFFVRLSIEAGWLGPAARTLLAAIFASVLLIGSELARRLAATRDDPRVGQVLAGAGIASAYATLYLAAALFHLIGPLTGFVLMIAVTVSGLFLALRHGPPTAAMALLGGFVAPLVAGYDEAGIGPLLAYLALFLGAVLTLSALRGWAWLAIAALVAAFGWAGLLIALVPPGDLGTVGGFIVAVGVIGTLAIPRAGVRRSPLRMAPIVAALVQLVILAPSLGVDGLAWGFYLTLSAAALFLAWRQEALVPAAIAAAMIVNLMIAVGLNGDRAPTLLAAPLAIALFGVVGALLSRTGRGWSIIALVGGAGPMIALQWLSADLFAKGGWMAIDLLVAALALALAWRHRDRIDCRDPGLIGGVATAAAFAGLGMAWIAPPVGAALPPLVALAVVALAGWKVPDADLQRLAVAPWLISLTIAAPALADIASAMAAGISFDTLPYRLLPETGTVVSRLVLPGIAVLAACWWRAPLFGRARRVVIAVQTIVAIAAVYVLLKQPLAIASAADFVRFGFVERALITDLALLVGWAMRNRGIGRPLAGGLIALALARLLWFDAVGLNPVFVAQNVGAMPLLNAATVHVACAAALMWTVRSFPFGRWIAAALTLGVALVVVRQLAHGAILTGPVGVAENWGYSAAMLALAVAWLARGLVARSDDLRLLGLALLTLTTLKVFLVDAAALGGALRILSFMGLGVALIAIGWAYRRFVGPALTATDNAPPAGPAPA